MVFLHGRGGTPERADDETGWSHLARREGFALALPNGLPPQPSQPPKFLTNPPMWNDGSESHSQVAQSLNSLPDAQISHNSEVPQSSAVEPAPSPIDQNDVGFLSQVLEDVGHRLGNPFLKTFLSGFSNGAGMTFRFASECADRISAIAPVAGHCWQPGPQPQRDIPTLYLVGTSDPLVPLRGGDVRSPWTHRLVHRPPVTETLERWARAINCSTIPSTVSEMDNERTDIYPGVVPFHVLLIKGLGHHWPGGKGQLNQRIAGPPSDVVNGTECVWEFFKRFV